MMRETGEHDAGNTTVSSVQLEYRFEGCDAQTCVLASHSPSVHVYYALRFQLERSAASWMQEFVSLGGLDSLLDSLCQMTGKTFTSFSDAILQIDCISCIRAVLNTHVGIRFLLQSPSAANKLVMGFEICNTLAKKKIVEMASAVCAHSPCGYQRIVEGLDDLKQKTNEYHRFSIVVNELKSAETVPHKTVLMTFINTIINCNQDLSLRCRMRNQMIGLTLLDVISFLQREETDDDLHIQLQTFHDKKHSDEEALRRRSELDLSSPAELTEALQTQAFGTSRMVSLVNILQDLLAIELLEKDDKDRLWGLVEQQVQHLAHSSRLNTGLLSSLTPRQVDDLLMQETQKTQSLVSQAWGSSNTNANTAANAFMAAVNGNNNDSMYDNINDPQGKVSAPAKGRVISSEPDLLGDLNNLNVPASEQQQSTKPDLKMSSKQVDFGDLNVYLSRPSLPAMRSQAPGGAYDQVSARRGSLDEVLFGKGLDPTLFMSLALPFPSRPMRNLKWVKIQDAVFEESKGCIWEARDPIPRVEADYSQLETLFADTHGVDINDEVALLAGETRLKINLFLNRLEVEPDELVRKLIDIDAEGLTLPLLQYLHDILPCKDEMVMLKQYSGSLLDIGMAEQFLLHLMDVPDHRTLVLGHLTRLRFSSSLPPLRRALTAMVSACSFLLHSPRLRDLMQLVLRTGNFINHGQFNGNASGLQLHSLKRLKDVNSTEPNHTLLHQLVATLEESDHQTLRLLTEIPKLDEASRHSPEEIRNDVTALNAQLKQFVVQLASAHPNITDIFHLFLEDVKKEFSEMQRSIAELRELSQRVAVYVCEPTAVFNLQTCLQHVVTFLKDIRKARQENLLYKRQKTQARRRSDQFKTKLRHKRLALEFGREACASSSMTEDRKKILERILAQLHYGNFQPVVPSSPSSLSCLATTTTPHPEEASSSCGDVTLKHVSLATPLNSQATTPTDATERLVTLDVDATPQRKGRPLELSHISVAGTPMINRPCSENFDDDLFHFTPSYPWKGNVRTSSANDLLDKDAAAAETPEQQQNQQPKPPQRKPLRTTAIPNHLALPTTPTTTTANTTAANSSHHHRSRSDLTDSILVQNKWLAYEELKRRERGRGEWASAPLAVPESSTTLATLNLEDIWSRRRASDHIMRLNAGPVLSAPQSPKNRKEKKGGIGSFFSRLSRAVLKPRNGPANVEQNILHPSQAQQEKAPSNKSPNDVFDDKENYFARTDDPKRSSKRMGRFRFHKHSA